MKTETKYALIAISVAMVVALFIGGASEQQHKETDYFKRVSKEGNSK